MLLCVRVCVCCSFVCVTACGSYREDRSLSASFVSGSRRCARACVLVSRVKWDLHFEPPLTVSIVMFRRLFLPYTILRECVSCV